MIYQISNKISNIEDDIYNSYINGNLSKMTLKENTYEGEVQTQLNEDEFNIDDYQHDFLQIKRNLQKRIHDANPKIYVNDVVIKNFHMTRLETFHRGTNFFNHPIEFALICFTGPIYFMTYCNRLYKYYNASPHVKLTYEINVRETNVRNTDIYICM